MLEQMCSKEDTSIVDSKSYFSHTQQLVMHQDPLYDELCHRKNSSKHINNRSKEQSTKCMAESVNRKKSTSRHKLTPVPKLIYMI